MTTTSPVIQNTDSDSYLVNDTGLKLFRKCWTPDTDKPRALVFLSHGVHEHISLSYHVIAEPLQNKGFFVFAHDHIGHGQSEGETDERAQISDLNLYVNDVVKHVKMMKEKYPQVPAFILGHSMGGAVALLCVLNNADLFKGMILISPAIVPSPVSATKFKVFMAKTVARIMPKMAIGAVESRYFCRDPAVCKKCDEDPLTYHGGMKARMAVSILNGMEEIQKRIGEISLPWLDIHGDEDKLTELSGSKLLNEKSASNDKTLKIYEGAYHQVHNEPDGVGIKCVEEVAEWVENHL